jgi:hypothetical protein
MTNIEIIRFRAWLAVGGEPDSSGDDAAMFPITSATITASLNAIPVATVTIATGIRLQDGKPSPIHGQAGAELRNPKQWPWAQIHFKNLHTNETTVIFEGFVESSGQSYSFASTEVPITIRHWLYALDAHPCISSVTHPSSASIYTQMLYYKSLPGSTGTGGTADQKTGLVFRQMMDAVFMAGLDGFSQDVIENGVKETLRTLTRLSEYYAPWDISAMIDAEKILKPDIPLSVETILAERIKTGDTNAARLEKDQFPILKIQSKGDSHSIAERMFDALMNLEVETYQSNSLWAALIHLAAKFGFMIVPRVHEVRFIPKWFMAKIDGIKELKGVVSSNGSWEHSRPIGAAIVLPTSIDGKGISAVDAPGMQSLENDSAMAVYGIHVPSSGSPGTLLVRQRADWAGEVAFPGVVRNPQNMDQKEANEGTTTTDDGTPPATKEADGRNFYDALAEEAYWDEVLKGRRADLVCPIRFDVCPGSTVRIKTGGDVRLMYQGQDQLTTECVGFVLSMKLIFDTINASASAQYTLTHVRDIDAQKEMLQDHPVYQCGPFSNATWTKKRFKTIGGSE